MALLALFQPDPYARARLGEALRDDHEVVNCPGWVDLWETALSRPVIGCVVDPYNAFDPVSLPELQHFRKRFPGLTLVVYGDFSGREMDLFHLGRLGADGVILAGEDDGVRHLRNQVELALSSCLAKRIADALEVALPPLVVRCVRWSIEHAQRSPRVQDLAEAMLRSPTVLSRELRGMGFPSPRNVLLWGRLFQATRLFREPGSTVEEVAFRLGYSTGASLARAFREQTGSSPSRYIRGERGMEDVLVAFVTAVRPDARRTGTTRDPRRWATNDIHAAVLRSFVTA